MAAASARASALLAVTKQASMAAVAGRSSAAAAPAGSAARLTRASEAEATPMRALLLCECRKKLTKCAAEEGATARLGLGLAV